MLSKTNILICYMSKTDLRMRRYNMMNIAKITRDLGKKREVNP